MSKNPGKSKLARCAAFALGNLANTVDELEILGKILLGEARCEFAEVAWENKSANHVQLQPPVTMVCLPSSKSAGLRMVPLSIPLPIGE